MGRTYVVKRVYGLGTTYMMGNTIVDILGTYNQS
jgi:hypothetical protein